MYRESTERNARRNGHCEMLEVLVEHIGVSECAYVLAVDHWDLSAWTTRCPTAALLSVFDGVAEGNSPCSDTDKALPRDGSAQKPRVKYEDLCGIAGAKSRTRTDTERHSLGAPFHSERSTTSGGLEGIAPLLDMLARHRGSGHDFPMMEVEIAGDDDDDSPIPAMFSFLGTSLGERSRTSKKSEPAPGPERTLAQHRAMTGSALAESNATALESPWANTPSTLAASISEFVHACFAAISNAPSLHGAPEVVDEQHSTKGIVVLRGSDHSEHVSTFDVAVQEASSKYPNVRLAFVLHDVAPEGIQPVWLHTAAEVTGFGALAMIASCRALGGIVEMGMFRLHTCACT
eukprot:m.100617 g.100617  ORF g.100617 m.100617 type:complete len:347 (-) comp16782_c2_seq22:2094-3134(-)